VLVGYPEIALTFSAVLFDQCTEELASYVHDANGVVEPGLGCPRENVLSNVVLTNVAEALKEEVINAGDLVRQCADAPMDWVHKLARLAAEECLGHWERSR